MGSTWSLTEIVSVLQERPLCTLRQRAQVAVVDAIRQEVRSALQRDDLSSGERLFATIHDRLLQGQTLGEAKLWPLLEFLCQWSAVDLTNSNETMETRLVFSNRCEQLVNARERLRKTVSLDEQKRRDQELFAGAGLVMFLDYLVVMYLLFVHAKDAASREYVLNAPLVSHEGFEGPGIRAGAKNDIMVTDFLLRLFADEPRDTLLDECFQYKHGIEHTQQPEKVAGILRGFLTVEIEAFDSQGVTKFSPLFPASFNVQTLEQVTTIINKDLHPA